MTSHDPDWPLIILIDLQNSRIAKRIGMLHIIWKLKTAVFLFPVLDHMTSNDHVLTSNDFLWPSMKRKVSIIIAKKIGVLHNKWKLKTTVFEHIHEEYQKKPENLRTLYVTYLLLFWIIWPLLTLNWTLMTLIEL